MVLGQRKLAVRPTLHEKSGDDSADLYLVECRRQKVSKTMTAYMAPNVVQMKCERSKTGPCRRCRNSHIECVFKPRVNARQSTVVSSAPCLSVGNTASPEVLERLAAIESVLGIRRNMHPPSPQGAGHAPHGSLDIYGTGSEYVDQDTNDLLPATSRLMRYSEPHQRHVWASDVVSQLWRS